MSEATNNKRAGYMWRELVTTYLQASGLPATRKTEDRARRVAPAVEGQVADIQGLDGWSVMTCNAQRHNLSGALDEARSAAEVEGNKNYATVLSRPGHDASAAYVLLDLKTFSRLVAETVDWAAAPAEGA